MIDPDRDDYDPMVVAAANRQVVRLRNGFTGRLVYWSKTENSATVVIDNRHLRVPKNEIVRVVK